MANGSPSADLDDPGRARSNRAAHAVSTPPAGVILRAAQFRAPQTGGRNTMKRPLGYLAVGLAMTFTLAACGGGSGGSGGSTGGGDALTAVGPIKILYSNN